MPVDYSVITICLNSEQTIGRTIDSVLAQTRLPRQHLFVDGGSSDGTREVIEGRFRSRSGQALGIQAEIVQQSGKGGIADAWNVGLARADGEIVFILNSDDWYEADCAARVMARFESDPSADLVIGSTRLFPQGGAQRSQLYASRPLCLFPFLNPINHPACFVRRNVYDRIGTFDVTYKVAADYDFLYRCFKARLRIRRDDGIVVNREGGGYAERNRAVSRLELNQIARKYCRCPRLPDLALAARKIAGR